MELNELITIVIPVKDEEKNLRTCLERIRDVARVVIVDSGSTDGTLAIAAEFGREVVPFRWNGQFPKKRNWILRNHTFTTPWVLFLDADEILTESVKAELAATLPASTHDAYCLYYDNWFMGRMLRHGDVMHKAALLRVGAGEYEKIDEDAWSSLDMEIHEQLVVKGTTGIIRSRLEHHDRRSLSSYYAKHNAYSDWEARRFVSLKDWSALTGRQRLKYRLIRSKIFPFLYFCASYILKLGLLDGAPGFYFALGKMFYFFQIQTKIREQMRISRK